MGNTINTELKTKLKKGTIWELTDSEVITLYRINPKRIQKVVDDDKIMTDILISYIDDQYKKRFFTGMDEHSKLLGDH